MSAGWPGSASRRTRRPTGTDIKALRAAAAKALAGEIAERAEKVATSPNGDFVLASDGTLRWRGAVIAADRRRRQRAQAALHPACRRRARDRPARAGAGPHRSLDREPDRDAAQAAGRPRRRRVALAGGAGHRLPPGRESRRGRPRRDRRRGARPRPGIAGRHARPRRPLRRASHLCSGAAQAGSRARCSRCSGR